MVFQERSLKWAHTVCAHSSDSETATGKCNLSKTPYLWHLEGDLCDVITEKYFDLPGGSKMKWCHLFFRWLLHSKLSWPIWAHLWHPALSQIPIPAKQLWSWNLPWKTTEISSSWRRNFFVLWQTERFGQTAEPSSVHWWVVKSWLNQSDLAGTGKLPVGPNWGLSGINWVQQVPVSARQMHPVIAALTVGKRQGSVKTRGWEMYHVVTESNFWKKDFCMEKFGVEKEKEGGKRRELTL